MIAMEEGQVVNQAGRLAKEVQASEAAFRDEGGQDLISSEQFWKENSPRKRRKRPVPNQHSGHLRQVLCHCCY